MDLIGRLVFLILWIILLPLVPLLGALWLLDRFRDG
jgi:hypothetical protein